MMIVICLAGLNLLSGCSKGETADPVNSIVGKWVTLDYHSIHNDTIFFTSERRVENYFRFTHDAMHPSSAYYFTYTLMGDQIKITSYQPESEAFGETFDYAINGNSLVIKGFSNPFSLTNEVRTDVHFSRVE